MNSLFLKKSLANTPESKAKVSDALRKELERLKSDLARFDFRS